jgi:hypothetical protein
MSAFDPTRTLVTPFCCDARRLFDASWPSSQACVIGYLAPMACPLLARRGHLTGINQCPLAGAKRTSAGHCTMSAFDPKRTAGALS